MATPRMESTGEWLQEQVKWQLPGVLAMYPSPDQDPQHEVRLMVEFTDGQKVEIIVQDAT